MEGKATMAMDQTLAKAGQEASPELPTGGSGHDVGSIVNRIDAALDAACGAPMRRRGDPRLPDGNTFYDDTDYQLQVGDGVTSLGGGMTGTIKLISESIALVEWQNGVRQTIPVSRLNYCPTLEQIEETKKEIQANWSRRDEQRHNNYPRRHVETEQTGRLHNSHAMPIHTAR